MRKGKVGYCHGIVISGSNGEHQSICHYSGDAEGKTSCDFIQCDLIGDGVSKREQGSMWYLNERYCAAISLDSKCK